jgi:hypothetical protein
LRGGAGAWAAEAELAAEAEFLSECVANKLLLMKVKGKRTGPRSIVTLIDSKSSQTIQSLMLENGLAKLEKLNRWDGSEKKKVHAEYEEFLSLAKKSRLNMKEKEIKRQTAGAGGLRNVGVEVLMEVKEVADAQAGDGEDAIGAEEAALTSSVEEAEAAPIVEEAPSAPIVGEQTPAVEVKAAPEEERAAEVGGEAADAAKDTFEDVKEACEE